MVAPEDIKFGQTTGYDFTPLIWLGLGAVLLIVFIFMGYFIYVVYVQSRRKSAEWNEFFSMLDALQLSREETMFMRTRIRKFHYGEPTLVLKKPEIFDQFTKRVMRRPSHHAEFILAKVRSKAFTNKGRPAASLSKAEPPSEPSGPVDPA